MLEVVRLAAPKVLPWNAFVKAIIPCLPVYKRASFRAPSTASAPELLKKNISRPGGITFLSISGRFTSGS